MGTICFLLRTTNISGHFRPGFDFTNRCYRTNRRAQGIVQNQILKYHHLVYFNVKSYYFERAISPKCFPHEILLLSEHATASAYIFVIFFYYYKLYPLHSLLFLPLSLIYRLHKIHLQSKKKKKFMENSNIVILYYTSMCLKRTESALPHLLVFVGGIYSCHDRIIS